ncbi:MAG: SUMF1/EgtB/PvdO family nonheme iron enzyme, partial [Bacteroidales bacterium]|nr:SUMF1/EgtB/PvdO family nonheme iron enzyme [Candidatus Colimorpha onthohippi]
MKAFKISCLLVAIAFMMASCSKGSQSSTTGWNLNDSEWGGFEVSDVVDQPDAPGLLFIEGGSFVMGRVADDSRFQWNNKAHTVTVSSFYMDETEVSNVAYREYVYWVERAFGEEFPEKVNAIRPDPNAWRDKLAWRESAVDYYFESPIYSEYPVVGVTWEQASKYCKWRTDRVNEKILVDRGIISLSVAELEGASAFQTDVYLAGLYESEGGEMLPDLNPAAGGEGRNVRKSDGILIPSYRLPTEAEWEFAALGMIGNTVDERIVEHKTYPWAGQSVRSANKQYYGQFLANFKRSRGDAMGVAGNLNDAWDYTAPVKWYFPNDYGLYHMAGNVSEWCMDVYRKDVNPVGGEDLNPFRGNVYQEMVYVDGEVQRDEETGDVQYKNIEDQHNRRNYRQADNVNYLDGDYASTIFDYNNNTAIEEWVSSGSGNGEEGEESDEGEGTGVDMSNQDEVSNLMYRRTPGNQKDVTSLINNKVRVVKGGSWNDRAYWMQAGTRRYYDQDKSTAWIGFRCAMDRIGSRTGE